MSEMWRELKALIHECRQIPTWPGEAEPRADSLLFLVRLILAIMLSWPFLAIMAAAEIVSIWITFS